MNRPGSDSPGRFMLDVEERAEIRRLRRSEGMSISQIARVVGLARSTVKVALASEGPPAYRREPAGSLVDGFEPRVRELLAAYPSMPATVIAERVGRPCSIRTLSGRVPQLPPGESAAGPGVADELRGRCRGSFRRELHLPDHPVIGSGSPKAVWLFSSSWKSLDENPCHLRLTSPAKDFQ